MREKERNTRTLSRTSEREGAIVRTDEAGNATATIRRQFAAIFVRCQCQLIGPTGDFRADDLSICSVIALYLSTRERHTRLSVRSDSSRLANSPAMI